MTKKEFKEAMLRGHGRCVIAVRQDPEKYREFVLRACKKAMQLAAVNLRWCTCPDTDC